MTIRTTKRQLHCHWRTARRFKKVAFTLRRFSLGLFHAKQVHERVKTKANETLRLSHFVPIAIQNRSVPGAEDQAIVPFSFLAWHTG